MFQTLRFTTMTLKEKCSMMKEMGKDAVIYCDMDGVLAKWKKGETVEEMWQPGYFIQLELEPNVRDALLLLMEAGFHVSALSAAFMNGIAEVEKAQWLDQFGLSEMERLFVPCGENKANFIDAQPSVNYILLDDYNFNLLAWRDTKKNGGKFVAVKYLNGINGGTNTWDGRTIYHRSSGETIAHALADIAVMA